ncbi:sensor histidine kinase [Streptomyces sp. 8L]|uniref:sensor histidine kinase n=1 Tax=Streptomyces sp. 8L TaxID=2877242 RepID=UPI001CD3C406|nr:sensor histidine kinase [Streptomyces sp. 8L]MCA1219311.1 sensor histidine kinase [Streptomyces sp. 8L]
MRIRWPRRVFAQVLLVQLATTTGVLMLVTGLFLAPLSAQLDEASMRQALAIAQTTAAEPALPRELAATRPSPRGPVQAEADRIRQHTGALYIVVMDRNGVRWSHTDTARIGGHVSTDPSRALAGRDVMDIERGTLGLSARGKVPLRDARGRIVGAVSVGMAYGSVRGELLSAVRGLLLYAGAALAAGALAAYAVSRRLQRRTHGLAFADISALLDEREAMLHGIREGVVALDGRGRVRLVNDEAQRLLGLGPGAAGRCLDEVLPPGRTADVLTGRVGGADLLTVCGDRVLVANRMPVRDGGAVATLRDRTELELLGRELDSTHGLLDALRAQDHEHANRLHTLLGLLELGLYEDAAQFVAEVSQAHRASAEQVAERVGDPLLAALLVGKSAIAAERGAVLRIAPVTELRERVVDPRDLVTVLGNLIDNALDAARTVEVELRAEGSTAVVRVSDDGPGVPPAMRERIFAEGWTTKRSPAHRGRGIGLALVRRLAGRYGGMARVTARAGGGAVFTVVLPEALVPDTRESAGPRTGGTAAYGRGAAADGAEAGTGGAR